MDSSNSRGLEESVAGLRGESPERRPTYRFSTSAGVVVLDPEGFIADVINSVNDLTIDGFNNLEEFVAQSFDLKTEEARGALKQGVDSIYNKVQDNVDEHLTLWESVCRDRYFNFPAESQGIEKREINSNPGTATTCVDLIQEDALDIELSSLQSELIVAHREVARMRRELTSLEKQCALRREVLGNAKLWEGSLDGAVLEDVIKSASLLKDTMMEASSLSDVSTCDQTSTLVIGYGKELLLQDRSSSSELPHRIESKDIHDWHDLIGAN